MEADLSIRSWRGAEHTSEFGNGDVWIYLDSLYAVPVAVEPGRDIDCPKGITRWGYSYVGIAARLPANADRNADCRSA
jgi:hypothetical protein